MIIETIVTTQSAEGGLNVAPMGVCMESANPPTIELRPFCNTTTFQNLLEIRQGVVHITDDATLIMKAALDMKLPELTWVKSKCVSVPSIGDCCRTLEFNVSHAESHNQRAFVSAEVVAQQKFHDTMGFNRAAMALIEATILVTRIDFVPFEVVESKIEEAKSVIDKTGDSRQRDALHELCDYVFTTERST